MKPQNIDESSVQLMARRKAEARLVGPAGEEHGADERGAAEEQHPPAGDSAVAKEGQHVWNSPRFGVVWVRNARPAIP
jgi:hypothetical protein